MNIKNICLSNAEKIYGSPLPTVVRERLDFELSSIEYCHAEQYYTVAAALVERSEKKGFPVFTRRGIASSFVAFLLGITEINPLEENIPVEFFMGYDGDKMPNIQLCFSNEYQKSAVIHLQEIFGKDRVIWVNEKDLDNLNHLYICKYFVLPKSLRGKQFCEIDSDQCHTLFSIDLLGHDIPTILRKLHKATGIAPESIPINTKKVYKFMKKDNVICREELFDILCSNGIEKKQAYKITEFVRNCRFYNGYEKHIQQSMEIEDTLRQYNISEKLISHLKNSRYFPSKADLLSYTLQEYRMNWYKEHYPKEFEKASKVP